MVVVVVTEGAEKQRGVRGEVRGVGRPPSCSSRPGSSGSSGCPGCPGCPGSLCGDAVAEEQLPSSVGEGKPISLSSPRGEGKAISL